MRVSVCEVQAESKIRNRKMIVAKPCGSYSAAAWDLQRSRIRRAGAPGVVQLVLNGEGSVWREVLNRLGQLVAIRSIDALPAPLCLGVGTYETGNGRACRRHRAKYQNEYR